MRDKFGIGEDEYVYWENGEDYGSGTDTRMS